MHYLLVQQGLRKALLSKEKLPFTMTKEAKEEILDLAHSAIQFSLSYEVLPEVVEEKSVAAWLWLKLESLFMTNSLTNRYT